MKNACKAHSQIHAAKLKKKVEEKPSKTMDQVTEEVA
jgi:hypothetical protein